MCLACLAMLAVGPPARADPRKEAQTHVDFGIAVARKGLWREAIYRFERATRIDPTYAAAFNNLAVAHEEAGMIEEARKAYQRALALAPKNTLIRENYELFEEIASRGSAKPP